MTLRSISSPSFKLISYRHIRLICIQMPNLGANNTNHQSVSSEVYEFLSLQVRACGQEAPSLWTTVRLPGGRRRMWPQVGGIQMNPAKRLAGATRHPNLVRLGVDGGWGGGKQLRILQSECYEARRLGESNEIKQHYTLF